MAETSVKTCYSASEKAASALEALKGNLTYNELAKKYAVQATQITHWKNQLKEGAIGIFSHNKEKIDYEKDQLIEKLYRKIGQLKVERDWLKKNLQCSVGKRQELIEPINPLLGINRQCELFGISRSGYDYEPKPITQAEYTAPLCQTIFN